MRNHRAIGVRGFLRLIVLWSGWFALGVALAQNAQNAVRWEPGELPPFTATQSPAWNQFPQSVLFRHTSSGKTITVDGFWDGGSVWKVRFALSEPGEWTWTASSSDPGLTGSGIVNVAAPSSAQMASNNNYRGHVKVGPTRRYFVHADGTPFLYVGDTLWAVSSANANANQNQTGNFYLWANDRKSKQFSVAQVASFVFPNEGGAAFPNDDWSNLNAAFFQSSDRRFEYMWQQGFVVAMHPTWITSTTMDLQQGKDVSRYILARYGAYNLVWSMSGEYNLDTANPSWSAGNYQWVRLLGSAVESYDPYQHPMSVHPAGGPWIPAGAYSSHYLMNGEPWLDHNWLQTYAFWERLPYEVRTAYGAPGPKPVILAEPCYENARNYPYEAESDRCNDAIARLQAWTAMLSGAAGHVYGAAGVYYMDDPAALNLPGSRHMGWMAQFFGAIRWWALDPFADCVRSNGAAPRFDDPGTPPVSPATRDEMRRQPRCAAELGATYAAYIPAGATGIALTNLQNKSYNAQWYNPRSGGFTPIANGPVNVSSWTLPARPDGEDWVVLLTATGGGSLPFKPHTVPGTIEAEDYDTGGEGVAYHDEESANLGGAYRTTEGVDVQPNGNGEGGAYDVGWTRAGEWLNYSVDVAAAGAYTLEVRVASQGPGGSFRIEFNGVNATGTLAAPDTGAWQNWTTVSTTVNLSAGPQLMRLVMETNSATTGAIANFNYIRLTPSGGGTAHGGTPRSIPGTIEAEDFNDGGEGVAYHDLESANIGGAYRPGEGVDIQPNGNGEGGAYDVGWTRAGEWLNYSVDVAAAGAYTLEVRVASQGPGGSFHIEFNGVNATGTLAAPDTGGWQNWTTVSTTVNLSAGPQLMRLVMDTNSATTGSIANFNYVRLTASGGGTAHGGTPRPIPGTIEAEDFNDGGEGVAYHDLESANIGGAYRPGEGVDIQPNGNGEGGAYDVGWTRAGEWLNYSVNVAAAGTYTLEVRVASDGPGGSFHIEFGGVNKTGTLTAPDTGGWQNWTTVSTTVNLSAGPQIMRLVMETNSATSGSIANFNYVRLSQAPSGLSAQWKLDEGAGTTAADASGNGHTGTLVNGAGWDAAGRFGAAVRFDGIDDYVQANPAIIGNAGAFTLSAWVKIASAQKGVIYGEINTASGNPFLYISINENVIGDAEFGIRDDNGNWVGISTAALNLNNGQWHHLAAVQRSKTERELFVDGVSRGIDNAALGTVTLNRAELGRFTPSSTLNQLLGSVDEVRVYNRALSAAEVQALFNGN